MTSTALSWIDYGLAKLGIDNSPAPAYKFYVEILGVLVAEFTSCSGLSASREVKKVREGGTNDFEWLLPGQITYGEITLKRGITFSRELWRWFETGSLDGQVMGVGTIRTLGRKRPSTGPGSSPKKPDKIHIPHGTALSIILGNAQGLKAKHWDLLGAIPTKWSGPDFSTDSSSIAIESLTIQYHRLDLSLWEMTPMGGFSAMIDEATRGRAPNSNIYTSNKPPAGDTNTSTTQPNQVPLGANTQRT